VLHAQDAWRLQMERQPVQFMVAELPGALRHAAERLADFLGTEGNRLAFVENASDGVNAVLRSFAWHAGDEVVLADHAYAAVRNTVDFLARQFDLRVHVAAVAFPMDSTARLVEGYCAAITERTRLAIIDHVFSPLAVVTPVEPIVQHCRRLGVAVLVDGAHGPGMLPLSMDDIGADWYVGNCHKWLCAPKGAAFIHRGRAANAEVHPTVISNFFAAGFTQEFDWQGTRDYSAWLAVPAALDFLECFGVSSYQDFLWTQAQAAAQLLCQRWQVALPAPAEAFGAMVTLPWPRPAPGTLENAKRWHDWLWSEHRIEVPVVAINGQLWIRISAQIYNELADFEALADAL
jgi:isopenicillin-N epimerase